MKTRLTVLKEMLVLLENDYVKQQILADYKKHQFENDPKYKGNAEAKKEVGAANFSVERTGAMIEWLKKQIKAK